MTDLRLYARSLQHLISTGSLRFEHTDDPIQVRARRNLEKWVGERNAYEVLDSGPYFLQIRKRPQ